MCQSDLYAEKDEHGPLVLIEAVNKRGFFITMKPGFEVVLAKLDDSWNFQRDASFRITKV